MKRKRPSSTMRFPKRKYTRRTKLRLKRRPFKPYMPLPRTNQLEKKTFDALSSTGFNMSFSTALAPAATPFVSTNITTGGCLNQIPLGNSSVTRIGRRVTMKAVQIRGTIEAGSSGIISRGALLLIWDRTPNQSANLPTWTSIMNTQDSRSLTNKDNAPRYKILRRWDFAVIGNTALATNLTDQTLFNVEEYIPLKNKVSVWTSTDVTGLYPTMMEGALLLYATSDDAGVNAFPLGTFSTRVYYEE